MKRKNWLASSKYFQKHGEAKIEEEKKNGIVFRADKLSLLRLETEHVLRRSPAKQQGGTQTRLLHRLPL
jgi:hypothetical protein